ncbi:MAG: hypothetical protein IKC99_07515, partial [Clostridia bacterium]|nr:hypothetical protein [Clostridia bacterium]
EWTINVETCLAVPTAVVEAAASAADLFIVDIKEGDPGRYLAYTGHDAALAWDNLAYLLQLVGPERIVVRVPRIPDYNTQADTQATVARLHAMGITQIDRFDYRVK